MEKYLNKNKFDVVVSNIKNYPNDGNHEACTFFDMDINIRRGVDPFTYFDENDQKKVYNESCNGSKRWVCTLSNKRNRSLSSIFVVKEFDLLDDAIEYSYNMYMKSLSMEIDRIKDKMEYLKKRYGSKR